LVTYAAHRVPHLCRHLEDALHRGVDLRLIVECEEASEGQLSSDAKNAFPGLPEAGAKLFYWPLAKRERNQAGRPGKLHAKCAVVDDVALVGSANLTVSAGDSKCTTFGRIKVHHFGRGVSLSGIG
jgi:phosphatidylserine/phosphatidylglycerophosphate/cardiolipin synthase-like enzyme